MNKRTAIILLGGFLFIRILTFCVLPLTDNTEARYAAVARDMANSTDWVTPKVWLNGNHVPYLGKPPLHFWASALSVRLFGENEFAVRFPSLVAAVILVILMWFILRRYLEEEIAHTAVVIVSSCVFFFVLAGAQVVDMTLALCIAGAVFSYQAFLFETARVRKWIWSLAVFIFMGLGFLTKGPVAIVMFGIPAFLWTLIHKQWSTLKHHAWWAGILATLAITVPWFWLSEIRNPGFLKYFFYNENFLRFITHDYGDLYGRGHTAPYGTAIGMLLVTGLPWTVWSIILLIKKQAREWFIQSLKDARTSLFSFALLGITLFLCMTRQLLFTYLLPVLPFFAVWMAMLLKKMGTPRKTILVLSVVSVIFYGLVYLLALPITEHGLSAKGIIRLAQEERSRLSLKGNVVFIPKTPYSAYFYGRTLILPHPEKEGGQGPSYELDLGKGHLYVINKKYRADVREQLLDQLKSIATLGNWTLYMEKQPPVNGTPASP
jgi:4-amino-4-deoxy-L-arabinose transferase-like glycosyltransferase